ncbi:MAG: hypothetical protein U1B80_08565 [Anaerolineaceae bacterium]|nr:hypothetical protein [Anaerolineaceae bacterium]
MQFIEKEHPMIKPSSGYPLKIGGLLVLIGAILLIDQYLKTGWLTLTVPMLVGFILLAAGALYRRLGWAVAGCLVSGVGAGGFLAFSPLLEGKLPNQIGYFLAAFGMGWMLIVLVSHVISGSTAWWALIPASVITASGAAMLFTPLRVVDFTLYILVGLGAAFLVWGLAAKLFGLIIPGCLLVTIGVGIYLAWASTNGQNSLARTGIMLVSFAFGWGLITLFSRRVTPRFLWWPLIPGGMLAMVGWGLYLSGNPDNAINFIGNTGSVGLILFGLYLLLLRRGIQQ